MSHADNRTPIVGGNWKMNTVAAEAFHLARELAGLVVNVRRIEMVIFPPFTNLQAVRSVIEESSLVLGAQDVFWEQKGAYTGEISPGMLKSLGVEYVIVGHSERRRLIGESSDIVNAKALAAMAGGLKIVLAVGETLEERRENQTEIVLTEQLERSLANVERKDVPGLVIAYEPVWAIGTGVQAHPDQVRETHSFIRGWLVGRFGLEASGSIRVQYGGSVTADNARDLLALPDVDGALVGGASLRAHEFAGILEIAERLTHDHGAS